MMNYEKLKNEARKLLAATGLTREERDMVIDIYRAMELRRRHGGVGSSLALGEC
jgi:hypothetical protein